MRASESPFERYMSKRIFVFRLVNVFLRFRDRFAIFNFSEKLQSIFEIGLKKMWSDRTKIALEKKS